MTDREKMEEVVRLDGRCEDCSKMVWKCNNCPIEKDCQDCSIQTYGRSLRLAREWLENDDMKRLIAKSGDALVKMFNACSKSKKEHEMKGKVIAEWQPVINAGVCMAPPVETKFKVGDEVVVDINGLVEQGCGKHAVDFAKSKNNKHIITKVDTDGTYSLDDNCFWFLEDSDLILVNWQPSCGEEVMVSRDNVFNIKETEVFLTKLDYLKYPFICTDEKAKFKTGQKVLLDQWEFVKQMPKYKAYTEPKLEWIKEHKEIKMNGKVYSIQLILFFNGHFMVRLNNGYEYSLQYLFENATDTDGTPFGEEL